MSRLLTITVSKVIDDDDEGAYEDIVTAQLILAELHETGWQGPMKIKPLARASDNEASIAEEQS